MIGFYGHTNNGIKVNQTCFSNFYPTTFEYRGFRFPSSEHALMASKAKMFWDEERFHMILKADTASSAKQYGRRVVGYNESIWAKARYPIMVDILIHKFDQNQELCEYLLSTGSETLVEASPYDTVWGVGLGLNNLGWSEPSKWRGQNLLGFALMEAREILKLRAS